MKKRYLWAALVLIILLVTVYCNFALEVEEWTVRSNRLPEAFSGLRIALVTDIHGGQFGPNSKTLIEKVRGTNPDYIAISGDLVDEDSDLSMLEPLLNGLTEIAPVLYVTGNHEWKTEDPEALFQRIADCGVTVFRNDYLLLEKDGQTMILAGVEDRNGYADSETQVEFVARIREEVPDDPYIAMLSHRNTDLNLWSALEVDLVMSGHGHGGVIRLPFIGGLLGVDHRPFPNDAEGLYYNDPTILAVSRGIGGVRLWNRPHLPVIVLDNW